MKIPPLQKPKARIFRVDPPTPVQSRKSAVLLKAEQNIRRAVLNSTNFEPGKTLVVSDIADKVVALAQVMCERKFYPYQVQLGHRIVSSLLEHDGDVVTALMSRQVGKTEVVGAICAAIAVILPYLAEKHPDDWHLNITDDHGNYRGFKKGIKIGIYAPRQEQAEITFERVRLAFETKSAKGLIAKLGQRAEINNGNRYVLSNGSVVMCQSASEQSKIEGATHHLLIAEEAQDISDQKMRKSLHPMTATTMGTIVKIGTASTQRCDFYKAINENLRAEALHGRRNHFFFPYTVCQIYNNLYARYIEREKERIGEDSDEFRMSYGGEWIFERGMFVTQDILFRRTVAQTSGVFSKTYRGRLPSEINHYSIVAGIDWGSSHDSTVVTLVAVDWLNPYTSDGRADGIGEGTVFYKKHVIGWLEFQGDNYEHQFTEIMEFLSGIPALRKIVTDSNTCGKPIYDRMVAAVDGKIEVEPFNFQQRVKSDGYKALAADFHSARLTFPAGEDVRKTREYRRFVFQLLDARKVYKAGVMQVSHPDEKGAHDDYPDSLMLAAWGASRPAVSSSTSFSSRNIFM